MTDVQTKQKSGKREVGICLLVAAAAISWRFWTLNDPDLVSSFGAAYSGIMFALIPAGLSPFAIHHIWHPDRMKAPDRDDKRKAPVP